MKQDLCAFSGDYYKILLSFQSILPNICFILDRERNIKTHTSPHNKYVVP